jgi:anti-anti-sigma factor
MPPDGHFACELQSAGRATAWVRAQGKLDLGSTPQLRKTLTDAFTGMRVVVLDLRELTFLAGTGVHAIVEADAQARRSGRRLVLVRVPAEISRVFELVGLADQLEIIDPRPVLVPAGASDPPAPADAGVDVQVQRLSSRTGRVAGVDKAMAAVDKAVAAVDHAALPDVPGTSRTR